MPLKLTLRFGQTAVLEFEGDATIDENVVKLAAEVLKAVDPEAAEAETEVQRRLDELAETAKGNQDRLQATIDRQVQPAEPAA